MITVDGVGKTFGDREVLRDIGFKVAAGDVACLIGASGSGKSTILRCINGLETHDRGTITVDGIPLTRQAYAAVRGMVSMVFQRPALFPHRSVIENVTEEPVQVLRERPEAAATQARTPLPGSIAPKAQRVNGRGTQHWQNISENHDDRMVGLEGASLHGGVR